ADPYGSGYRPSDTLLSAASIRGSVSAKMLLSGKAVHLSRLEIKDAEGYLSLEPDKVINFERVLSFGKKDSTSKHMPPFSVGKIYGQNIHFRMVDWDKIRKRAKGHSINYEDLDTRISELVGRNLSVHDGYVSGTVDKLAVKEKSGADVVISGRTKVGHGQTIIKDLRIKDSLTDFHAPLYSMTYENTRSFKHYCQEVRMRLKLAKSTVASKTINWFAEGNLENMDFLLDVDKIDAEGYVCDLNIKEINFTDLYGGVKGDASCRLSGITITKDYVLDAVVKKMDFSTAGAEKFAGRLLDKKMDIGKYAKGQRLSFSGSAKGPLSKLAAKGRLRAGSGSADANLRISNLIRKDRATGIEGTFSTRNLKVGEIIEQDLIGMVTANTGFKANLDKGSVSVRVDSLMVDKLGLLGYDYTGIAAAGTYSDNAFDGKIICADPNLNFIFQGIFNLSPKTNNALYKFSANVGYADLQALNLDKRGGTSKVSAELNANLMKIPRGDLLGDFNIYDLTVENDNGVKYIGDIYAGSHTNGETSRAQIRSNFLDAGYVGNRNLLDFFGDIQTATTRRELPALYSRYDKDNGDPYADYDISIDFHDSRDILSFIKPGFYIADSTRIDIRMSDGRLNGKVSSPRLAYLTNYLKGLNITIDNEGGSANATLVTDELQLGQIGFTNSAFTAFAQKNDFFLSFHYDNIVGIDNMGEIYLAGNIERDATDTLIVNAKPLSSYVRFDEEQWDLAESDVRYRAGEARFKNFLIFNGDQSISINGGISPNRADTLRMDINKVDMSVINHFTGRNFGIKGLTTGKALLSSPLKGDVMGLMNLACDSLEVGGESAGSLRMALAWDKAADKVSAFIRDISDGMDAVNIRAALGIKSRKVDVDARLDGLKLALLSPVIPDIVDNLGGTLHGSFTAAGTLDSLALASNGARVEDGRMKVKYTGVDYKLGGPFHLEDGGIFFDNFSITDPEGGHGSLNGGLRFRNLKDLTLDARADLSNLMFLGNKHGDVYGDLYASGDIQLSGPLDNILVDADVFTNKAGNLHISLGGASSAGVGDLLTFTDHNVVQIDPYELMLREILQQVATRKQATSSNIIARARINATPDLEAMLELDSTGDNFLTARGSGTLDVEVNLARRLVDVTGDYNISNGKYHFAIPGIVSKNFNINSGSSIKFGGGLSNSELDIDATYSVRTSINRLMADTSSVATRRMVNCGISITDKITSPKLGFSIDIPDLDPTTKSEVESALNTEDKVQKQFLSLIITGGFLESEQTGIINNNNLVFSNVSELMSRQLSNLLNRMDIPVDLGVGYQQNSSGTDLYDVSVSTELFDNRVEVRGSFGNRQYSTTTNPNGDMVGDLDIDVKLDRPGELRLNLFSHSADEYTSYLDYSQRNGVGLTYQKEFNKWSDFLRNLFRSRKKRQQTERDATLNEEKRTISIEADE
ncbi:MAG: translocation/assembly module TamB, partial [Bacteroidales bacterium]|nr:translocation/assembly module TamB [Bacteroidales bacterium]